MKAHTKMEDGRWKMEDGGLMETRNAECGRQAACVAAGRVCAVQDRTGTGWLSPSPHRMGRGLG